MHNDEKFLEQKDIENMISGDDGGQHEFMGRDQTEMYTQQQVLCTQQLVLYTQQTEMYTQSSCIGCLYIMLG